MQRMRTAGRRGSPHCVGGCESQGHSSQAVSGVLPVEWTSGLLLSGRDRGFGRVVSVG